MKKKSFKLQSENYYHDMDTLSMNIIFEYTYKKIFERPKNPDFIQNPNKTRVLWIKPSGLGFFYEKKHDFSQPFIRCNMKKHAFLGNQDFLLLTYHYELSEK